MLAAAHPKSVEAYFNSPEVISKAAATKRNLCFHISATIEHAASTLGERNVLGPDLVDRAIIDTCSAKVKAMLSTLAGDYRKQVNSQRSMLTEEILTTVSCAHIET